MSVLTIARASGTVLLGMSAAGQALVPAGAIDGAVGNGPLVLLAEDDPAVVQFVTTVRDRLFAGGEIVAGAPPAASALQGRDLVVYATPGHAWFAEHAGRLPFAFDGSGVTIDGRRFTGARLRVIASLRNPADPGRRAVVYAAARAGDLAGINGVFHGPTEWVVADGDEVLAAGPFMAVTLPVAAMQEDLGELLARIQAVHPAAAAGLPPAVREAAAAACAALGPATDRGGFLRLCARVLGALGDAHSALVLPRSAARLLLPCVWLEEGPVVTADAGGLRRGDRIVAFGGREPAALLAQLGGLVPAETPGWLRHRAPELLADVEVLRLAGLGGAVPVTVRVARGPDAVEHDVAVPAAPLHTPPPAAPTPPEQTEQPWVRYEIEPEHSLGVFTLDRCTVDEQFLAALAAFFTAVHEQRIGKVAVDLRANSGGSSRVVDEFLRYVDVAHFTGFGGDVRWSEAALRIRGEPGPPRLEPARRARIVNDRHPHPPPFAGRLFVLTGPATFSSANWFAVIVHDNRLGTVVGEPTGSAPSSYGDILRFALPHSAAGYTLSFKHWVRPDPTLDPADCLRPDVHVPRTAATVAAGTDPVLEWLRAR